VTVLAVAFHPVVELALDLVERAVGRRMRVLEVVIRRRFVVGNELPPGKADVDGHPIAIAMAVMMTCQLEHDVARDDAVEDVLELFGPSLHMRGECFGVGHTSECELKGYLHAKYLRRLPAAPFVRARVAR
jgi:hypothetical protein